MKDIPQNVKVALKSIAPLLVVIVLFILVGKFGFAKVQELRTQIDSAKVTQNTLSQKISIIQSLSANLSNFSSSAAIAMPDGNTALAVISQLKNLATINGLLVTDVKSSSPTKGTAGLSSVKVSIQVSGTREQISGFVKAIPTIAPITVLDELKITESAGVLQAAISVNGFWAVLPAALPTSSQSLSGLTNDEQAVLSSVNSLTPPSFASLSPVPGGRTDPFSE